MPQSDDEYSNSSHDIDEFEDQEEDTNTITKQAVLALLDKLKQEIQDDDSNSSHDTDEFEVEEEDTNTITKQAVLALLDKLQQEIQDM